MVEALVELHALGRSFGPRHALRDVELTVQPGEILGLAGPNGSGKTTLLKILAGLLSPTTGSARVFGLDPATNRREVMRDARFAFAPPPLYDGLTAREHLVHLLRLHSTVQDRQAGMAIDEALELVGLSDRADDRVRAYSFGMRQRLVLAQALLPRPHLLVLDEPTDGLDPLAVLELRDILARLRSEHGVTILLSSHLLIELDELVDRLLVLEQGEVLFHGPPGELRDGSRRLVLRVADSALATAGLTARGLAPVIAGSRLELPVGSITLDEAQASLREAGTRLEEFLVERPSLEAALLERLRARRAEKDGR